MSKEQTRRLKNVIAVFTIAILVYLGQYALKMLVLGEYLCPIYKTFGLHCPGCGTTRMFIALLHLDIRQAFRWNPCMFVIIPIIIIIAVFQTIKYIKDNVVYIWFDKVTLIITALIVLFGILRNIEAFSFLRPTQV